MKKGKWILIGFLGLLLFLVILREAGIIHLNLYKSVFSSTHSSSKSQIHVGGEKGFSYHVILTYGDQILDDYRHSYNNSTRLRSKRFWTNLFMPAILPAAG